MRHYTLSILLATALFAEPSLALDCSSPTLKGASGVIGNTHSYKVTGDCTHSWTQKETGAGSSTTTNYAITFAYIGSATWNRLTGEAVEKLKFTGDATGERYASANCTQDPFLKDPPGGVAKCGTVKVQAKVDAGAIYEQLLKPQFWAGRKLSLVEAQALSALPKPTQPPPRDKPKTEAVSASPSPADATVGGTAPASGVTGTGAVRASQPPQDAAGRAAVIEQMQRGPVAATGQQADSRRATQPPSTGNARAASAATSPS